MVDEALNFKSAKSSAPKRKLPTALYHIDFEYKNGRRRARVKGMSSSAILNDEGLIVTNYHAFHNSLASVRRGNESLLLSYTPHLDLALPVVPLAYCYSKDLALGEVNLDFARKRFGKDFKVAPIEIANIGATESKEEEVLASRFANILGMFNFWDKVMGAGAYSKKNRYNPKRLLTRESGSLFKETSSSDIREDPDRHVYVAPRMVTDPGCSGGPIISRDGKLKGIVEGSRAKVRSAMTLDLLGKVGSQPLIINREGSHFVGAEHLRSLMTRYVESSRKI